MKVTQRIRAISVSHPISINRKIDQYLSEHLPDMMAEYNIADRSDISEMDSDFEGLENRMDDLDTWKVGFGDRLTMNRKRMDRLKVKYGVK